MKKRAILFLMSGISTGAFAQGTFSGDFMTNLNFYQKDAKIHTPDNPLYSNLLSGNEAWLGLRYNVNGFTFFARVDAFDNSNLKTPGTPKSDFGIGAWSVTKDMNDLSITVGSIYDQVGSGILFRAYEDRGLLIDNALVGAELKYKLTNNIQLKGFVGQQKNNAGDGVNTSFVNNVRYAPVIKGFNAEGNFSAGKVQINPGVGLLNRTLDQGSMDGIVGKINSQALDTRFVPTYNMYAFTGYNTLNYKNFSWYVEGAYKTHEAIYETRPYETQVGNLVDRDGNIEYTSINYGKKGIALSLTGKRTENFVMRTSPNEKLLDGGLNWQPVVAVLRPERLISRYTPASQDISEMAGCANLILSPTDVASYTLTYVNINTLDGRELYREGFAEANYIGLKKWGFEGGVQYLEYNLALYQGSSTWSMLYAVTPFAEITYHINEKKSLRAEIQYMDTKQDLGSWAYGLLEYNIAPRWSLSAADAYNITNTTHYYNFYAAYSKGPHRFSLAYVKQVDGYNCSGGVCRYEPAFSGVKATMTSSF